MISIKNISVGFPEVAPKRETLQKETLLLSETFTFILKHSRFTLPG